jgi:uncharacterized membrane protein YbhN (UPF0104 family)
VCDRSEVSAPATGTPISEPEAATQRGDRGKLGWALALGVATIVALVVLVQRLEAMDLVSRVRGAAPGWVALALAVSVLPVIGNAISLVALTPGRLPFWRTVAVQLATSFVNLVTPASAGGLALNVRYLHRRGLAVTAAAAVVGLVQTTAVLVTAVLLLCLLAASGHFTDFGGHVPWLPLLIIAALSLALGIVMRLWEPGRSWLARNVLAHARKAWPQLRATLATPHRLAAAVTGHLIVTLAFAGTLGAAVAAFDGSTSFVLLASVVVGSSAAAGAVPVPGGIGAAEAALVAGLVTAGLDAPTALSAALLYRLVTFWARVPVGWVALLLLRRHGAV